MSRNSFPNILRYLQDYFLSHKRPLVTLAVWISITSLIAYVIEFGNSHLSSGAEQNLCHILNISTKSTSPLSPTPCNKASQDSDLALRITHPKWLNPNKESQYLAITIDEIDITEFAMPVTVTVSSGSSIWFNKIAPSRFAPLASSTGITIEKSLFNYSLDITQTTEPQCSQSNLCYIMLDNQDETEYLAFNSIRGMQNAQTVKLHIDAGQSFESMDFHFNMRPTLRVAFNKLLDYSVWIGTILATAVALGLALYQRQFEHRVRSRDKLQDLLDSCQDEIEGDKNSESLLRCLEAISIETKEFPAVNPYSQIEVKQIHASLYELLGSKKATQLLLRELGRQNSLSWSDESMQRVLQLFSPHDSEHKTKTLLEAVSNLFRLQSQIHSVTQKVDSQETQAATILKPFVDLAMEFWQTYGEFSRDFVIQAFQFLHGSPIDSGLFAKSDAAFKLSVRSWFIEEYVDKNGFGLQPLFRDQRIQWNSEIYENITIDYDWPAASFPSMNLVISPEIHEWLEAASLNEHPFIFDMLEDVVRDPKLINQSTILINLRTPEAKIVASPYYIERMSLSLGLLEQLRHKKNLGDQTFTIWAPIFGVDIEPLPEWLGHILAETWLYLIAANPHIFHELQSRNSRNILVGLLLWHTGSLQRLKSEIQQQFDVLTKMQETASTIITRDQLLRELHSLLMSIEEYRAQSYDATHKTVSWFQLYTWLSVRPMYWDKRLQSMPSTTIVIPVGLDVDVNQAECHALIMKFVQRMSEFSGRNIYLKLFIPPQLADGVPALIEQVKWLDEDLDGILQSRLGEVLITKNQAREQQPLEVLFEPSPDSPYYHEGLIKLSNGSLSRMLEIGRKLITCHVTRCSDNDRLEDKDWDIISAQYYLTDANDRDNDS